MYHYHYRLAAHVPGDRVVFVNDLAAQLTPDLRLNHRPRIRFVEPADGPGDAVLTSWPYKVVGWFQPALTVSRSVVYLRADLDDADLIHGLAEELRHMRQHELNQFPRRAPRGPLPPDHPLERDAHSYAYSDICRRVLGRRPCRLCNISHQRQLS